MVTTTAQAPTTPQEDPLATPAPVQGAAPQADAPDPFDGPVMPGHLSPSGAAVYRQCPRRWKLRYIDKLPDPKGIPALVGTFAHKVLEDLLALGPEERTLDTARVMARDLWPATAADSDFVALELDAADQRRFKWKAWLAIEGLWELEDPKKVVVRATEQRIDVHLDGVPFLGVVDRVDVEHDGIVIADYKSGKPPKPRYEGDKLDQVVLYAAAIEQAFEERPVRARLLYLGARTIEVDITEAALAEAVGGLSNTWSQLLADCEAEDFAPRVGPLCGWCPYAERCPEGKAEVTRRYARGLLTPAAPAVAAIID